MKRTIATSRSDDNPTNPIKKTNDNDTPNQPVLKEGDNAHRYRYALIPMQTFSA
jgi:hypothetical protein